MGYLEALCDQAALAVERAQVVANLERRVREMDVLTRVAQGINITLSFDDILELIYAQISFIIPCKDFHITLRKGHDGPLYHAFYLENDDRLASHEKSRCFPVRCWKKKWCARAARFFVMTMSASAAAAAYPLQPQAYLPGCVCRSTPALKPSAPSAWAAATLGDLYRTTAETC